VIPCTLVHGYEQFGRTSRLHLLTLNMWITHLLLFIPCNASAIVHIQQHMQIKEIISHTQACISLHVSAVKSPYSDGNKYNVKHNKNTAIYLPEDGDLIAETCRRVQAYV